MKLPRGEYRSSMRIDTPGGAGFGDPHERDPAAVAADIAAGRISAETAKTVHGVDAAAVRAGPGTVRGRPSPADSSPQAGLRSTTLRCVPAGRQLTRSSSPVSKRCGSAR